MNVHLHQIFTWEIPIIWTKQNLAKIIHVYWPLNKVLFHNEPNLCVQYSTARSNRIGVLFKKVTSLDLVNENLDYIQNEQHQHHINFPCVSIESISMVNTCSTYLCYNVDADMLYMWNHLLSWSMVIINWMVHLSLNILLFVFIFQSSMLVLAGIGMAAIGFGGKECDSHFYSFEIFMKC